MRKATHRPVQTDIARLLPIRPGMPKVRLWDFAEVFELANFSQAVQPTKRLEIDYEAVAEDKAEVAEIDGLSPTEGEL